MQDVGKLTQCLIDRQRIFELAASLPTKIFLRCLWFSISIFISTHFQLQKVRLAWNSMF